MNLKQMTSWGQSQTLRRECGRSFPTPKGSSPSLWKARPSAFRRSIRAAYGAFRSSVGKLALQLPDRLPDDEKLAQIRSVVREFEGYRRAGEDELRNRTANWRSLVSLLFRELLKSLGIDPALEKADQLLRKIGGVVSAEQIEELHAR